VSEQEFSFEPSDAEKVVTFFKDSVKPEPAPTFGPQDVDNLAESPLAYTEVCEAMLKELYTVTQKRKACEEAEKGLKAELKKLLGLERGMIQRGQFGVKVADKKGRETTNWAGALTMIKCWAEEQLGKEGKAEVQKFVKQNTHEGSPTVAIQPYMVGSEPQDDD
jgi:hypothetical protein